MLISRAKYNTLLEDKEVALRESTRLRYKLNNVVSKWDKLVDKINSKGGQDFLDKATIHPVVRLNEFTKKDINTLIKMTHPDKNKQSDISVEMTRRLLELRKTK